MIFFTDNKTTTDASKIPDSEIITSLSLATWAGQTSEPVAFRIATDDPYGQAITATTPDPSIQLSLNSRRGYGSSVSLELAGSSVSDSIFVRAIAALDVAEGNNQATIFTDDGSSLVVTYFFAAADSGDTETAPPIRFLGQESLNMQEQFSLFAEAVKLIRYEPLPNPQTVGANPFKLSELDNISPEEKCNPNNEIVGYTTEAFNSKAFVGDRSLDINRVFDKDTQLSFVDSERILLPPEFQGFDPSHITHHEFFGEIGPSQPGYQRTQWTLLRHDGEYSIANVKQQKYYNGQFIFWSADLVKVVYPQGYQDGFLPWNQIYQTLEDGGQVIAYVSGYSKLIVEDPYLEDAYLGGSDV